MHRILLGTYWVRVSRILNLSLQRGDPPDLVRDQWPCFILAGLLFFRFLIGSANHLWFEHVTKERSHVESHNSDVVLVFDLFSLTLFGLFALLICYSRSVDAFLFWSLLLIGGSILWGFVEKPFRSKFESPAMGNWSFWRKVDFIQASALIAAILARWRGIKLIPSLPWSLSMILLIPIFLYVLKQDFFGQLQVIKDADKPLGG